ncbi:MAG: hypothetical protein ACLT0A_13680 [Holdemanella porci]|uniref:hypothetical protein n=1 Tax=Holdemanella TaxID=1573535 RepID=UPI003994D893
MCDNPFLFSIMTILYASIAMFGISLFCKFFGGSESSEDEQLTPEKARQYLLDKYKAEMKQNHPEIDFNNSEDTVDFCLKLQSMDDDALEMAYNKVKEQYSE